MSSLFATFTIKDGIQALVAGRNLEMGEAASVMTQIMSGEATPGQIGSFLTALRIKGETAEEIAGMARVMREKSLHVEFGGPLVDTCGTGGDGRRTFNISTAAAFVVAGAGLPVAKHGNRAASSASGSADVLERLGVKIALNPESVRRCLEEVSIGFMFAQAFHPAMKFAAPVRREIGIRTVFNILGPLTNPAGARAQLIGIAEESLADKVARALALLGTDHAFIVHGADGSDEIAVQGTSTVWQVKDGDVKKRRADTAAFGLPECSSEHLVADSVETSASIVRSVLAGKGSGHNYPPSPERSQRTAVVINAAAALVAGGKASSFQEAADLAMNSIDSGKAAARLESLARLSQTLP
ncbi:MAG: anthranilate phosphoribosyltransferase [Chloroflexi bacterium]|nr:anthranilate phosphoribosyltransferase [Chloroflexota bacterium]